MKDLLGSMGRSTLWTKNHIPWCRNYEILEELTLKLEGIAWIFNENQVGEKENLESIFREMTYNLWFGLEWMSLDGLG